MLRTEDTIFKDLYSMAIEKNGMDLTNLMIFETEACLALSEELVGTLLRENNHEAIKFYVDTFYRNLGKRLYNAAENGNLFVVNESIQFSEKLFANISPIIPKTEIYRLHTVAKNAFFNHVADAHFIATKKGYMNIVNDLFRISHRYHMVAWAAAEGGHLTKENIALFLSTINDLECRKIVIKEACHRDPSIDSDFLSKIEIPQKSLKLNNELLRKGNFNYKNAAWTMPALTVQQRTWLLQGYNLNLYIPVEIYFQIMCQVVKLVPKDAINLMLVMRKHLFDIQTREEEPTLTNQFFSLFKSSEDPEEKRGRAKNRYDQAVVAIKKIAI